MWEEDTPPAASGRGHAGHHRGQRGEVEQPCVPSTVTGALGWQDYAVTMEHQSFAACPALERPFSQHLGLLGTSA
jgi:hypothetical protein